MPYWYRRVFLLAIPLILSNLTQPLLSTVDTVLSGHLPGPAALGGVAIGGIFFNSIYWTFGFLRMATTGLVAQSHGAQDEDAQIHHFGRALLTALLIGAIILILQRPLISFALTLLGASSEVRHNALIYCTIRIWSAPAALANYTILGYLLGRQHARTALILQATINVVNVAVALALVLHLHWGVAGIATATMTAEWSGFLIGIALMLALGAHPSHLRWTQLIHGPSLRHLFALNRDILLRTLSLVGAYVWFTRTGARSGDAILAANSVLINFLWIAGYGLDGFANAAEALVGQAIGAQRLTDYRSVLKACSVSAFTVAAFISLAYLALGHQVIALFTNQEPIRILAAQYLPWLIALPLIAVWSFLLDGVFIGATRTPELRDSMLLSFLGYLLLAIFLSARFGNHGLWAAMLAFMALRAVTLALRLPAIERKCFSKVEAAHA
ncbi:MATE family efflux transporter [Acidicapsa dinghuensis]|uniref:MATE family efflux transporter n=1 Tax=Acidicapsa dinghuensis TaxID=2218256 RepID=A0ABW1EG50_9BACT|nr:MATE family efflux transporter [Acidicapsa dinghuensis]